MKAKLLRIKHLMSSSEGLLVAEIKKSLTANCMPAKQKKKFVLRKAQGRRDDQTPDAAGDILGQRLKQAESSASLSCDTYEPVQRCSNKRNRLLYVYVAGVNQKKHNKSNLLSCFR